MLTEIHSKNISTILPPTKEKNRKDNDGKQLTIVYNYRINPIEVECKSSPGKDKCHFVSTEFGEAIFDKESEQLIASTKELTEDYYKFLCRNIKVWKRHFSNI